MINVSARTLKIMAALVWYTGGIFLMLKGRSHLILAEHLDPGHIWPWLALLVGLTVGVARGMILFRKTCRKNLARIDALNQPKIWQFFRPWFFFFLALMIMGGATLSRLAHGNYIFLIAVATLDFSVSGSLLGSSYVFWKDKAFAKG